MKPTSENRGRLSVVWQSTNERSMAKLGHFARLPRTIPQSPTARRL